jgi:hypothetical protein
MLSPQPHPAVLGEYLGGRAVISATNVKSNKTFSRVSAAYDPSRRAAISEVKPMSMATVWSGDTTAHTK